MRLIRAISIVVVLLTTTACGDVNRALEQLSEARHLAANLHVQFLAAAGATDRAVMADTDQSSAAFAREAEQATQAAQRDIEALGPMLQGLKYADEARLLETFVGQFNKYRELDRQILDLAVQNTNLKAQQLSFGPAQEAVDRFAGALDAIAPRAATPDDGRLRGLAAAALAAVREIQVLQAPHMADPSDTSMTNIERNMTASEAEARAALQALAATVPSASRPKVAAASAALDQFLAVNAQITSLSRQNTNVRSLALSLDQKRTLTAPCEASLKALEEALAKRAFPAGRWVPPEAAGDKGRQ